MLVVELLLVFAATLCLVLCMCMNIRCYRVCAYVSVLLWLCNVGVSGSCVLPTWSGSFHGL